jgi:C4-dicarboxylate transporter DctM subunit
MSPHVIGIIGLVILFILLAIRLPVGYAMALIGLTGFVYLVSAEGGLTMAARICWMQFSSYSFSVVPLFLLMGQVAFYSGISKRLYDTAQDWMGHLRGGLAMATVGACAGFAAVCGSSVATAATMGEVALPEMPRYWVCRCRRYPGYPHSPEWNSYYLRYHDRAVYRETFRCGHIPRTP